MFGNECGVDGLAANGPTNPFRFYIAGFGETTYGEKAIDLVGVMGIPFTALPTLLES